MSHRPIHSTRVTDDPAAWRCRCGATGGAPDTKTAALGARNHKRTSPHPLNYDATTDAEWQTTCPGCGYLITVGDEVFKTRIGWVCRACAADHDTGWRPWS